MHMSDILHQLLQRLCINKVLNVVILQMASGNPAYFTLSGFPLGRRPYSIHQHNAKPIYLCSLIVVELEFSVILKPKEVAKYLTHVTKCIEKKYARAFLRLWRKYHQQCLVKSLLRLCILQTRSSMNNLDDKSLLSLPVPPRIRRLLTYQDIADVMYEHWSHGPTFSM